MESHISGNTLVLGVAAGLAAAFLSAFSYFVSRDHGSRGGSSLRLLVLAHALMGAACVPASWLLWPRGLPADVRWLIPLGGSTAAYLLGQVVVFTALKMSHASRVAPLLGLKIAMLAGITCFMPGESLDARQWIAVAASVVAAVMLQRGGGMPPAALAATLAACLAFATADLCIVALIDGLQRTAAAGGIPLGRLHAGGLAMSVTYVLCGALATAMFVGGAARPRGASDWRAGLIYATAWLGGMAGLYTCFGLVGAVFGNILQSSRGIMSIAMGAGLAHYGRHDLEMKVDRATFVRRIVAGCLMTAAIALYVIDLR